MSLRALILGVALASPSARAQAPASLTDSAFAVLVAKLSEPAGYFDTDNLISNEDSYLHPVGTIKRLGAHGGAFIGVGPDQNFSYIAAIRPRVAIILDIRRDNLLEHMMFKAIFSLARNRLEYLCLLFGVAAPADTARWNARDVAALVSYLDRAPRDSATAARIHAKVLERVKKSPLALSESDLKTVARFHATFMSQGLGLRFNTFGRPPQGYYPDYRQLLLETDRTGRQSNYLAHEGDFQVVKSLEDRNLVIPIVGDFGGKKALAAIAEWLKSQRETVSAFYLSNVEQYLFRESSFAQFERNVARLPRSESSLLIRSYFMGGHPAQVPGYHATLLVQSMDAFVSGGGFDSYYDLVTTGVIKQ